MEKTKRKVILDCDPGIDDTYAICLTLLAEEIECLAIHTVSGNISVEHTTRNVQGIVGKLQKIFGQTKKEIEENLFLADEKTKALLEQKLSFLEEKRKSLEKLWIVKGNERPLICDPIFAADIHGSNGLSGYIFSEEEKAPLKPLSSVEAYKQCLDALAPEEKVNILAVGPLTNVAIFLKAYPEYKEKIACISLMGGGIKGGNITALGEFNFYVDPHAADIVLQSGLPILFSGLDVTEKARLHKEDIDLLKTKNTLGEFLYTITQNSLERNFQDGFGYTYPPNDVVALFALLYPEMFLTEKMYVRVCCEEGKSRGYSFADVRTRLKLQANVCVLKDVNQKNFREKVLERLCL